MLHDPEVMKQAGTQSTSPQTESSYRKFKTESRNPDGICNIGCRLNAYSVIRYLAQR